MPRYEYRPQNWDLRDVMVTPVEGNDEANGDAVFETNFVTCVVQTTVDVHPKKPTLQPSTSLKELSAFAVDRKKHTFKGSVEIHDADTSSVLVNETHRLVTRGRRRCLPGPEGRQAFERFLLESLESDRIVVVRLLDDQRGRKLPQTLDVFAKVLAQEARNGRDASSAAVEDSQRRTVDLNVRYRPRGGTNSLLGDFP